MSDLEQLALEQLREELNEATSLILRGECRAEELTRTGTPMQKLSHHIQQADRWAKAIEDNQP